MSYRKPRELCTTPRCRNEARSRSRRCYKCIMRTWRAANPMMATYHSLKSHAKARGIPFTISFEYFSAFAIENNYLALKGLSATSLTIDRKKNHLGYIPGNLQPLSRSANSSKRHNVDSHSAGEGFRWIRVRVPIEEGNPF